MQWKALALALLVQHGSGQGSLPMLRFECSQLVIDRLDPIVNPGIIPSDHLHQVVGGNSFNASMDPATHDPPTLSTCTSCTFSEDFSNYWTAVMFFRARNGSLKRVSQFASQGLTGNGGVTVYYIPAIDAQSKVTAFKPGFRMLVGNADLRTPGTAPKICHRCMPETGDNNNVNCSPPDSQTFPKAACAGGIRSVITFPTCWDGVNTDSPDHQSHVAFPSTGDGPENAGSNGNCPSTHSVSIPQIMYEVMWDTRPFNDKDLWPTDGSQPFVWSTGDKEGYSQHGDYLFGWKGDALQLAMDNRCNGNVCSQLQTQTANAAMKCTKSPLANEDNDGWLTELPGIPVIT